MDKSHGIKWLLLASSLFFLASCAEGPTDNMPGSEPELVFVMKLDPNQERLNNIGQSAPIPANHRGQNPRFNSIGVHYIELSPQATTLLGEGEVLYQTPSTSMGGSEAIDFDSLPLVNSGEVFYRIPLSKVPKGNYTWIRVSLAYQNYEVDFRVGPPQVPVTLDGTATLASFIGYNSYVRDVTVNTKSLTLNQNKLQGFWAFETQVPGQSEPSLSTGQVPAGGITVPNPIWQSSPIPQGSCVVTGPFDQTLEITGNETKDIRVEVSLSINKSFEWKESGNNNYYEPLAGDTVVDMGIRGLKTYVVY